MNQQSVVFSSTPMTFVKWLVALMAIVFSAVAQETTVVTDSVLPQHLRSQFENSSQFDSLGLNHAIQVKSFYDAREHVPVWSSQYGLYEHVARFLLAVDSAYHHGLQVNDFHRDRITYLSTSPKPDEVAELDLLLTDAFFTYARRMGQGHLKPSMFDNDWHYELRKIDSSLLLNQVFNDADMQRVIQSLEPQHKEYKQLVSALKIYTDIQKNGGWPQISVRGESLEYGGKGDEISVLRQRLRITNDLDPLSRDEPEFDVELEKAVKKFQGRHGLDVDGKVGRKTRLALNASVEKRIEQLMLNLERWRWLPRDFGDRYIMVNAAGFNLTAFDGDREPLSMKVIVGKQKRKTPSFSEVMTHVVVNPYWNIPTKLALEDLIPKELSAPGYMEKKQIRVFSGWDKQSVELDSSAINWKDFEGKKYLPYRLRQDPGRSNSLGRIKFMFPNRFSVYMHDTPSRRLFNRSVRTYSSGCVRLERPFDLASYYLDGDARIQKIRQLVSTGKRQRIRLSKPVSVHLLYLTAWANQDGKIQFRNDVYRKDALMMAQMPASDTGRFTLNAEKGKAVVSVPVSLLKN
ncbi:MAG: L,D-transpeptidase family protein [Gammaproteobacteria bacterium]